MRATTGGAMNEETVRDVTAWCHIRIDREGTWFYEGQPIINPGVLQAFQNALQLCDDGRYRIVFDREMCYIEVEDTPFVAISLRGDNAAGFTLVLNNGATYALAPETLRIGADNAMYARLPNGMPVRLSRPAYYHLALSMEESETGAIVLRVGQATYPILTPAHP